MWKGVTNDQKAERLSKEEIKKEIIRFDDYR